MKQTIGILLALALALALGMTACSGTEDPAQSGASGSAPAAEEVSAACEHEWIPASFTAPETCARCGETRGGLKEDYFDRYCIDPEWYVYYWGYCAHSWMDHECAL